MAPPHLKNGEFISSASDTLAGTLDVVLENGFQPTIGETFQLLSFTTESGQFSSLDFPPGYTFDTSALYTQGDDHRDIGSGASECGVATVDQRWIRAARRAK